MGVISYYTIRYPITLDITIDDLIQYPIVNTCYGIRYYITIGYNWMIGWDVCLGFFCDISRWTKKMAIMA